MDLSAVRTLVASINFEVFGVDVQVVPPAPDDAFDTRGVWMTMPTEAQPSGLAISKADLRYVMAFRRDLVPRFIRGTRLLAPPPQGGDVTGWRFEALDRIEATVVLVWLVPDDAVVP